MLLKNEPYESANGRCHPNLWQQVFAAVQPQQLPKAGTQCPVALYEENRRHLEKFILKTGIETSIK